MNKKQTTAFNIPGTLPNTQSFQLLVSSGIPSLDKLLGDGLAVGTLTLIEEDTQGVYARIILKYFLAEGVVNKHSIFVATQEVNPDEIINHLPALVQDDISDRRVLKSDEMKIAFRYTNLPTDDPKIKHQFGHYFDLSSTMSSDLLEDVNIHCWQKNNDTKSNFFTNPSYGDLLETIASELKKGQYRLEDCPQKRNILKIGIYGLGSPLWMTDKDSTEGTDLRKFLLCLRTLLRTAYAIAVVTIPAHLYSNEMCIQRCINYSDVSIRLQALSGTQLENNKYLADYHGYFHIDKMSAINTFASKHPGPVEYMFKLRRKKFSIEVLHLPPEIEDSDDKKSPHSFGCASNTKHLLEF